MSKAPPKVHLHATNERDLTVTISIDKTVYEFDLAGDFKSQVEHFQALLQHSHGRALNYIKRAAIRPARRLVSEGPI